MGIISKFSGLFFNKNLITHIKFNKETATLKFFLNKNLINSHPMKPIAATLSLKPVKKMSCVAIGDVKSFSIMNKIKQVPEINNDIILEMLAGTIKYREWKVVLVPKFYHFQKKNQSTGQYDESIIQVCEIEGLDSFYRKINDLLKMNLKTPMTYVTLYANHGHTNKIIADKKDFKELNPTKLQ